MVGVAHDVVRHDRDLAAAAGCINDELRHRVPGGVTAEALDDLQALADRRPEVPGALDQVALVEVVGPDPVLDQALDQLPLGVDAVVDARQEHGLVAQRDART